MTPALALSAIPWLVGAPVLGAAMAFVAGRNHAAKVAAVAIVMIAIVTVPMVWLVWDRGSFELAIGGWQAPLGIALAGDGLSATLIATTTLVCSAISIYAAGYLPRQHQTDPVAVWRFWPLWLFLWAGINAALLSADLFNLYIAIEIIGLSSVALVALSGGEALIAALRYALVTFVGSLFYLLGVALLYADYGLVDIATLSRVVELQPATGAALLVMTLGLMLKAAIAPLHFWLAPAHASALSPISAVLSGLVVKAMFYVLLRLWIGVFPRVIEPSLAEALGVLGVIAIVWGSLRAIVQRRLKLLVAYSTVAQLGYLLLAFPIAMHRPAGAAAWSGLVLFMVAHALAKAAMFLAVGNLQHAVGSDDLGRMRGVAGMMPTSSFALALAGIALIGLPPSSNFIGKWLLLSGAIATERWAYVIVIVGGSLLAAAYVFPMLAATIREPIDDERFEPAFQRSPTTMQFGAFSLAAAAVGLGLLANPVFELINKGDPFNAATAISNKPRPPP